MIKVEAGIYLYRGVRVFKDKHHGFAYSYSIRTDKYSAARYSFPVPLKMIAEKIDHDLDMNGGVASNGRINFNRQTKVGA